MEKSTFNLSLNRVIEAIDNPLTQFVDTRQDSFFNGYTDQLGVQGHIIGAIQFPVEWLNFISTEKLQSFIIGKGIVKSKEIIIYDSSTTRAEKLYYLLKDKLNYENVTIFKEIQTLYNNQPNLFIKFPNFKYFVSPEWLKKLIDNKPIDNYDENGFSIYEVNSSLIDTMPDETISSFNKYINGHIPGALYLDLNFLEDNDTLNITEYSKVLDYLSKIGISESKTIILYSRNPSAAARAAFILKWAGIEDVRLLNGSIDLWQREGYPIEEGNNCYTQSSLTVEERFPNENLRIENGEHIYSMQVENKIKLVSIRSWNEHVGLVGGYENLPSIADEMSIGEPYNAIWGFAGEKIKQMEDYYDPDGTYRNPNEMSFLWRSQGITSQDKVAFYCGTGWRACLPFFYSLILGWNNSCVYDGSWIDWQKRGLPLMTRNQIQNINRPDNLNDYL